MGKRTLVRGVTGDVVTRWGGAVEFMLGKLRGMGVASDWVEDLYMGIAHTSGRNLFSP